jgi:hypothetical protein
MAASRRLFVSHQTESETWKWCAAYGGPGFRQVDRSSTLGRQLACADLIVCRAGATTLAEIGGGKPAILVPLPTATTSPADERRDAGPGGAAVMLTQRSGPMLALAAGARRRRARISAVARSLARPDAARLIVDRAGIGGDDPTRSRTCSVRRGGPLSGSAASG